MLLQFEYNFGTTVQKGVFMQGRLYKIKKKINRNKKVLNVYMLGLNKLCKKIK